MANDGTADVSLDPLATANYLARQSGLDELQSAGPLGDNYALSMAYTEGDQTPGSIIQKMIDSIPADERLALPEMLTTPPTFTAEEQAWLGANPTITVAYDPGWPPYEYVDGLGHLAGLSGAYASMFAAMTGSDFVAADNIRSWQDSLDRMRAGTADVVFTVENTAERDAYMDLLLRGRG